MDGADLLSQLPPLKQKVAVLALALFGSMWIFHLVRVRKVREEHALLWFLGLAAGAIVVWVDPLLVFVSGMLGVDVPASALLLLAIFFLFVIAVRLTAEVSSQKAEIAKLTVMVSIMRAEMSGTTKDEKPRA
jgi:hypothetical protein